jgi:predicted metal-dependent enzyme (double-stranded beta helix superfamily)
MVRFDLERFIDDVRHAHRAGAGQAGVHELVARAVSTPASVLKGLGEPTGAGIFKLYHDSELTILNIVWAPLMVLLPHNHTMWATIGIYTGREDNILWRSTDGHVTACGGKSLCERDVFSLNEDAVHSVVNPIERLTAAIHVYGGDFFAPGRSEWDPETLTERPFDTDRNLQRFHDADARFRAGLSSRQGTGAAAPGRAGRAGEH